MSGKGLGMRKVLILGGTGFIGFTLAKLLAQEGSPTEVVLVDNFSRGRRDAELETFLHAHPECRLLEADLSKPESFESFEGKIYDEVYLLAAVVGVKYAQENPAAVVTINTRIILNVLDWARKNGVGRLLFASTSEVYAGGVDLGLIPVPTPETVPLVFADIRNPRFSYAASKLLGEAAVFGYAQTYGLPVMVVRFHNVYGPRMGYEHVIPELSLRAIRKEDPFRVYGIEQTRAFCFVTDAVLGMLAAMRCGKDGEIYNIGNDREEIRIGDLAELILRLAHHSPRIQPFSPPAGSVARRCPDLAKLRALGYTPVTSLGDGLRVTLDWYRDNQPMAAPVTR
jgi:UDP-glucose 4-epimerase/UDP-glucuronate decarboxylase